MEYHHLNDTFGRETYPLPHIKECFEAVGTKKVSTVKDTCSRYCQISVNEADFDRMAFICHLELYRYKRMPSDIPKSRPCFNECCILSYLESSG